MKAHYLAGKKLADFIEINSPLWSQVGPVDFPLIAAPIALQPTEAVSAQWEGRKYGLISHVTMSAIHNGEHLGLRLEWDCSGANQKMADNDEFLDGAAIMLPCVSGAPILLMGDQKAPVNACYWRADEGQQGRNIVAHGFGTTRTVDRSSVICRQERRSKKWLVVISRPLLVESQHPQAQLRPGDRTPFGVAIWDGSNQERAGIKSVGVSTEDLFLEPVAR